MMKLILSCCLSAVLILFFIGQSCVGANYIKMWGPDRGEPSRWDSDQMASPYEQALIKKIQANMEANGEPMAPLMAQPDDSPAKRQIRYHQCYFNPISCFRKRK